MVKTSAAPIRARGAGRGGPALWQTIPMTKAGIRVRLPGYLPQQVGSRNYAIAFLSVSIKSTGDEDAALEQHLFNPPKAQQEPEVQLDLMGDDLWWEAIALVAGKLAHVSQSTRLAVTPKLT